MARGLPKHSTSKMDNQKQFIYNNQLLTGGYNIVVWATNLVLRLLASNIIWICKTQSTSLTQTMLFHFTSRLPAPPSRASEYSIATAGLVLVHHVPFLLNIPFSSEYFNCNCWCTFVPFLLRHFWIIIDTWEMFHSTKTIRLVLDLGYTEHPNVC